MGIVSRLIVWLAERTAAAGGVVAFSMLTIFIARASDVAGRPHRSLDDKRNGVCADDRMNITVTTLVGQKLGENRPDWLKRATWTG